MFESRDLVALPAFRKFCYFSYIFSVGRIVYEIKSKKDYIKNDVTFAFSFKHLMATPKSWFRLLGK